MSSRRAAPALPSSPHTRGRLTAPRALGILIAAAVLIRLGLAAVYEPVVRGDALTYVGLARLMAEGRFHTSIGHVAPVYPAFLLLCGLNPGAVWAVQSALAVVMATLLFSLALRHTGRPGVALTVGLFNALSFDHLFYEPFLVTEPLGTFFTVVAFHALGLVVLAGPTTRRWLTISTALALAGLLRSLPLVLAPVFAFALVRRDGGRRALDPRHALAFVLPLVALVGGWSLDNKLRHDYFGPSTMTGYRLMQHTGAWIERAPDEFAMVRDIYLKHRGAVRADQRGEQFNTIWRARDEMEDSTGLDYAALSKRVQALSFWLVRDQPLRYAASVAEAWIWFWSKPIGWKLELIRPPSFAPAVRAAGIAQRLVGIGVNAAFLALAIGLIVAAVLRRPSPFDGLVAIAIVSVLAASLAQALTEISDNGRFGVPFQPLVQYAVIVGVARWQQRSRPV
jgi:hypothetical protein